MDAQGRKAEISLALGKNPCLPTQHPDSSPCVGWQALQPPVLLLHSLALCTHIAPGFQKENTLPYLHKENWELLPAHWFAPFSMADGPGSSHPWHRSRWAGRLETKHHHWFAQASLRCNKWGQKQLPLSKSLVPSHRAQLHCRVFERWWLLFHRGWQQIDSATAPSVRDLNPPLIDMTYHNGFFGYLSSHCVLRKL